MEHLKQSKNKLRYSLLPFEAVEGVVKILEFGAKKYGEGETWRMVEKRKYIDASLRHLASHLMGETIDQESSLSHIDHAICNLLFVSAMEKMK